jgi:WD40 repeat protein
MKKLTNKVVILALITIFLLNGCGTSPLAPPTSSPTAVLTSTPVSTSTPAFTPTPIPVSIKDAIEQGAFSEIKTFGKGIIRQSTFSPDGSMFIAVASRGIYIYVTEDWREIKYIPTSVEKKVEAIDISVDGKIFAIGDSSGNVIFWNTKTWEMLKSIKTCDGQVTSIKISPDGLNFITVENNKLISTWDLNSGTLIVSREQKEKINSVYYSSDSQWVLTSAGENFFVRKTSNLEKANKVGHILESSSCQSCQYAVSPFGNLFAFMTGSTILIQDIITKKFLVKLETEYTFPEYIYITDVAFIDKNLLAIKSKNTDFVSLIDIETSLLKKIPVSEFSKLTKNNPLTYSITKKKEIQSLGFEPELVYAPDFITSDGNTLILHGLDWYNPSISAKKLWQDDTNIKSLEIGNGYLMDLSQRDENLIVVKWKGDEKQGNFALLEIAPNDMNVLSETHFNYDANNTIEEVALSPDGKSLAAGSVDGTLYLWDINKRTQIVIPNAHKKTTVRFAITFAFSQILFSPDGSLVATYGTDPTVKIWGVQDGKEITSILNTEYASIIFSPDSKSLFYAKQDGVHKKAIYENSDEVILNENSPNEWLSLLQFSPDGSMLFGRGADTTSRIKIWSVADKKLLTDIPLFDGASFIAISPDETLLYIVTRDGIVSVWGHTPQK